MKEKTNEKQIKKRILICGVGGIGSYLTRELNRLIINEQIDLDKVLITIIDDDEVELKNIKYQNFEESDILEKKAKVIGERYAFDYEIKKINNKKELKGYDMIVLAVDNSAVRKLIYDYCNENDVYFIDLRSEGRNIVFFTKDEEKETLIKSLGKEITKNGKSCQLKFELENNIIQNGNVIIASIGSQLILNWLRGEFNPSSINMRI
jgi:molybdopterin/thiamine biosynthesis adenylyltransferase